MEAAKELRKDFTEKTTDDYDPQGCYHTGLPDPQGWQGVIFDPRPTDSHYFPVRLLSNAEQICKPKGKDFFFYSSLFTAQT